MRTLNTYLKTSQAELMTARAFPESKNIKQNQRQERREKSYAITLKSIQLKNLIASLPVVRVIVCVDSLKFCRAINPRTRLCNRTQFQSESIYIIVCNEITLQINKYYEEMFFRRLENTMLHIISLYRKQLKYILISCYIIII